MIGLAIPRIIVGFRVVEKQWFLQWRAGLYRIPQGYDKPMLLRNLLPFGLHNADFTPPDYVCSASSRFDSISKVLRLNISEYDSFGDEGQGYVIDATYRGVCTIYDEVPYEKFYDQLDELVSEMEVDMLQLILSE